MLLSGKDARRGGGRQRPTRGRGREKNNSNSSKYPLPVYAAKGNALVTRRGSKGPPTSANLVTKPLPPAENGRPGDNEEVAEIAALRAERDKYRDALRHVLERCGTAMAHASVMLPDDVRNEFSEIDPAAMWTLPTFRFTAAAPPPI